MTSMSPRHENTGSTQSRPPVRTCVGCKKRVPTVDLLRVVVGRTGVIPDVRRRLPGRGAWLHLDPSCLDNAVRRRAFGRALRVPGTVDLSAVHTYIAGVEAVGDGPERSTSSAQSHTGRSAVPDEKNRHQH
ncbi:YlxR family protein [Rhodococcus sp. P1Y]|uniref:YlxR family protein n=1 Tax=Rhodococcus sp. P1Y TaxID=1302308 RepID=UPI003FA78DE9